MFETDHQSSQFDLYCSDVKCVQYFDPNFKIQKIFYDVDGTHVHEVVAQIKRERPDGCKCVIYRSVNWPNFDEKNRRVDDNSSSNSIQSEVSLAGYYIEPLAENKCRVTKLDSFGFEESMNLKFMSKFTKSRADSLYQLYMYCMNKK